MHLDVDCLDVRGKYATEMVKRERTLERNLPTQDPPPASR